MESKGLKLLFISVIYKLLLKLFELLKQIVNHEMYRRLHSA